MTRRPGPAPADGQRDEGSVLVLVLVMMIIGSLIVLPLLTYTSTVFRAGEVQQNKTRSIELARGGTWIALNNKEALFDMC
ncbi:MAG: hypothetical protein HKN41_07550, partial [Ilumatobacter sp.]|nr:hypothetical protein [Ilumatobacter sp.]